MSDPCSACRTRSAATTSLTPDLFTCIKYLITFEKWYYDGAGNQDCLDLDPDINGNYGQIITLWHDCDDRELVAVNFRSWLEKIAEDLESGVYIYNQKYNYLEEA